MCADGTFRALRIVCGYRYMFGITMYTHFPEANIGYRGHHRLSRRAHEKKCRRLVKASYEYVGVFENKGP